VAEARWVPRAELAAVPMPDGARYILGRIFPEHVAADIRNLKH
jgi:hypothetical protein